jgi:hypothetical protein
MAEDINAALRALANRWAMRARDYARTAKEAGASESQAAYERGYAEAYYRAATELAELLKGQADGQPSAQPQASRPVSGAPAAGASAQREGAPAAPAKPAAPPAAPAPPAPTYPNVPLRDAYAALEYGGCQPQEITQNKDNSFRATFSSWGKMMLHQQVNCVQASDPRIVIINSGKMDTHDYFIEFAFKDA